jgi:hypothetical protein
MNVSEQTVHAIHELNGHAFCMNRWWDATVSVLGVTYACHTASGLIHQKIAHWYPAMADTLNERCLENFNILAYYPATPAGDVKYDNLVDMMAQMLDKTIEFQNAVMGVKQIAHDMQDYMIEVEIDNILLDVNKQVAQMILIHDKAQQYNMDYTAFDKDFPTFFML